MTIKKVTSKKSKYVLVEKELKSKEKSCKQYLFAQSYIFIEEAQLY